jgi:hypothetical protein
MEVGGPQLQQFAQAERTLGMVDARLDPAYDVLRIGRVALGDAPISFASTAVGGVLRAGAGRAPDPRVNSAIGHAGLMADGLARGLLYSGGLLHGAAAAKLPWLVTSRVAPDGLAGIAASLSRIADAARLGLLGIGGTLGALRAARAVLDAGGDGSALYATRDGRGGVLQAVGSALLMVKHPATYLAGAAVFAMAIANDFS